MKGTASGSVLYYPRREMGGLGERAGEVEGRGRLALIHPEGSLEHSRSVAECLPLHGEEGR